jgi:VWFA-related protein
VTGETVVGALIVTFTVLLVAPAGAQEAVAEDVRRSQESARDAGLDEEIEVNLVQVPILVWDRKGDPITDLRREEVVVKDRGEKREVAFVEPFDRPPSADQEPPPEVELRIELPGAEQQEPPPTADPTQPRRIIFYVDIENDPPTGRTRAAAELIRFVRDDLDSSYRVAVLSFNGQVNIEQTFTYSRMAISNALRAAFDRPPRPNLDLQARIRGLIRDLEDCIVEERSFNRVGNETCMEGVALTYADEVRPRAEDFLIGLEALVRFASGLEGRKSIIAVSHGVAANPVAEVREAMKAIFGDTTQLLQTQLSIMSGEGARNQMDVLMELAVRQEVTLHFVDRTLAPSGDTGARLGTPYAPGAMPMTVAYSAPQEDLKEMAANTGGTFVSNIDLYEGVKQAMAIEKAGYLVGYYTDTYLPRDTLAKVKIDVERRGVRVSHRRGTYARVQGQAAESIVRGRIAFARPEAVGPGRLRVPFQVSADPRDLGYERVSASAVANFTLHMRLEGAGGRLLADSFHFVNHSYPWELWEKQEVEPVLIAGWVEVPQGEYRLAASFKNPKRPELGGELERTLTVASRQDETETGSPPGDDSN